MSERLRDIRIVLAALALVVGVHGPAHAAPLGSITGAAEKARANFWPNSAPPPSGFYAFCLRNPDQCGTPGPGPTDIPRTSANVAMLQKINDTYNDNIKPMDDFQHYGRVEFWAVPSDGYGDCEDYALAKRKALLDRGIPLSALRLAIVFAPGRGRHVVLVVATDQGNLVLDSLRNEIVSPAQSGYSWIEEQDALQRWIWRQPPGKDADVPVSVVPDR